MWLMSNTKMGIFFTNTPTQVHHHDWDFNRKTEEIEKFLLFYSLFRLVIPKTPSSSLLIKDSQVRGWWVNTGVRSQISMIGMNNPMPAPLIYFTSVGREAGKWDWRKTEMQSKLGAGVLVYFLLSLGQTLWYYKKKITILHSSKHVKVPFQTWSILQEDIFPFNRSKTYSQWAPNRWLGPSPSAAVEERALLGGAVGARRLGKIGSCPTAREPWWMLTAVPQLPDLHTNSDVANKGSNGRVWMEA